jgi:antitoxin component of MazEF toxin-antitoxin module
MEMMFKAKKKKIGNSSAVIIPKPIADFLDSDASYLFLIREDNDDKDDQKDLG